MPDIVWIVLALILLLLGVGGVIAVATHTARRRLPPLTLAPGETMPATALQRLARQTLLLALPLMAAAAGVVIVHGLETTWANDSTRLGFTGLVVGSIAAFAFYHARVGSWTLTNSAMLDERDRAILASAPAAQAPAMLVVLAAWIIGLTEHYQEAGGVPTSALYALFWSVLLTAFASLLIGVLLGYRRS